MDSSATQKKSILNSNQPIENFSSLANSSFVLRFVSTFLSSPKFAKFYYLICFLSAIAVSLVTITVQSDYEQNRQNIHDFTANSSPLLLILFSLFCLWEASTIFLPYLSIKYLEEIYFSKDFRELFNQHANSELISFHNRIVVVNLFGMLTSTAIYCVLVGVSPGISFLVICSFPLFSTLTMAILNLQLIMEANRKFLQSLNVLNWWETDIESSNWNDTGLGGSDCQRISSPSTLLAIPLLARTSESLPVPVLSPSILTQYYTLLRHYKLCSMHRGMAMGLYLLYVILILLIMIGFSYYFQEARAGVSGIIIITDLMFTELVIYLAHVNEIGYQISSEYIGIYALTVFQTTAATAAPSSRSSSAEDRLSLQFNRTTTRDSDWKAKEALELLSCSKSVPMEIKVLSCLVIRYRLAFAVMWGLAVAIIPRLLLS
jgi:hypothetical protein